VKEVLDDGGLGRAKGLALEGEGLGAGRAVEREWRDAEVEVIVMSMIGSDWSSSGVGEILHAEGRVARPGRRRGMPQRGMGGTMVLSEHREKRL
jgi:hypothetical protein